MIDGLLPDTLEAKRARVRHHAATRSDMAWLRIATRYSSTTIPRETYICDCRCRCHGSTALTATGATPGSCGLAIDADTLDCVRGCRAAHILASECILDETREAMGVHV